MVPLKTEHTCSGICHEAVVGLWGSADSANSVHLYYEHLNVAGVLAVVQG